MFKFSALTLPIALLLLVTGVTQASQPQEKVAKVQQTQFGKVSAPVNDGSATTQAKHKPLQKDRHSLTHTENVDFWIYDSWVTLYDDFDYDGFYSRFRVEFDADTVFADVPVYAVIYLGNEDTYESIYVTSEFSIYGEDSHDSLVIDSELMTGFPPYDYDILIELYDAQTEELLAISDGYDDADLAFVSLESTNYDQYQEETVVVVEQHGGAISLSLLLMVGLVIVLRMRT